MYVKDSPPDETTVDTNPMSKGPGRFVYRDGKFVWSRDDLRHIEGKYHSDVKLPPPNWKELMKEADDKYNAMINKGNETTPKTDAKPKEEEEEVD